MADRPIIFSAPMVCALIEGRKTQTRRVLKRNPSGTYPIYDKGQNVGWSSEPWPPGPGLVCHTTYRPGDRLWVREAIAKDSAKGNKVYYRADHSGDPSGLGWRPSIHMPRWASRLTLTVTDVRVQRLQDISEADAIAEGVERLQVSTGQNRFSREVTGKWEGWFNAPTAQEVFANLWNSLHGPRAWDANPWVVALTFTVEQRNIDAGGA